MKVKELNFSRFFRASDIEGQIKHFVINNVTTQDLHGREKLVLGFEHHQKDLVLNRTNTEKIADVFGEETDDWVGRSITIRKGTTEYQGRLVPCIVVEAKDDMSKRTGESLGEWLERTGVREELGSRYRQPFSPEAMERREHYN